MTAYWLAGPVLDAIGLPRTARDYFVRITFLTLMEFRETWSAGLEVKRFTALERTRCAAIVLRAIMTAEIGGQRIESLARSVPALEAAVRRQVMDELGVDPQEADFSDPDCRMPWGAEDVR